MFSKIFRLNENGFHVLFLLYSLLLFLNMMHFCPISCPYLSHFCPISCPYLAYFFPISCPYQAAFLSYQLSISSRIFVLSAVHIQPHFYLISCPVHIQSIFVLSAVLSISSAFLSCQLSISSAFYHIWVRQRTVSNSHRNPINLSDHR